MSDKKADRNENMRTLVMDDGKNAHHIDWRKPHLVTYALIALIGLSLSIDLNNLANQLFDGDDISSFLTGVLAVLMRKNASYYASKVDEFQPTSSLDAKRANEQIKSLANAISGLAAAGIVAVSVRQLTQVEPDYLVICLAVGIGFYVHNGARDLLGRLKDEAISVQ